MINFDKLADIIKENSSFILTTHVNPDADALGSELALYEILKQKGKKTFIINYSETPYNLGFMDPLGVIETYNPVKHDPVFETADVIAALDFNNPKRVIGMERVFTKSKSLKICIDHHENPSPFAAYYFNDTGYAATGHILYDFIKTTKIIELGFAVAQPLYAAIMTDTGSFRFDRTTPEIHLIIAELLKTGVSPFEVYDKIYDESRYSKIRLLGECLSTIRMNKSEEIAYMVITQKSLEISGAEESEVDGFVNYCLSVKGVKIGMLFFELKDGLKVSFRSKGNIPVNKLASEFGGGGHMNASGLRVFNASLNEFMPRVLDAAEKYLK